MITLTAILKAATTPKTEPDGDIAKGNSEDEDFFDQLFMSFSDGESKETNSEESKTRQLIVQKLLVILIKQNLIEGNSGSDSNRAVKISQQLAHFIGYSEKCAGYSKCLQLYFHENENDRGSDQGKTCLVQHPSTLLATPAILNLFDNPVAKVNGVRWYGHVLRRDDGHVLRKALEFEVKGKRKQGRPKKM